MVQDFVEKSNGWYVNFNGVHIENGAAKFKNSYVIVPVVTNNDFYDQISISLSFLLENSAQNVTAILGNSECKFVPTFTIHVINANTNSPKVVGTFTLEHKGKTTSVSVETNIVSCHFLKLISHLNWVKIILFLSKFIEKVILT